MDTQKNKALSAAILGGLGFAASSAHGPMWGMRSYRTSKTYPHSSKRQGERLERQRASGMLDFSASERCLAAIKSR